MTLPPAAVPYAAWRCRLVYRCRRLGLLAGLVLGLSGYQLLAAPVSPRIKQLERELARPLVPARRQQVLDSLCTAWEIYDTQRAIGYGRLSLQLARQRQHPAAQVRALNTLAACYLYVHDYLTTRQLNNEALLLARRTHDADGIVSTYNRLAALHYYRNDSSSTWRNFRQALALADRPGVQPLTRTILWTNVSNLLFEQQDTTRGLAFARRAVALARTIQDPIPIIQYHLNVGIMQETIAPDQALAHLQQGVALARQARRPRFEAQILAEISLLHLDQHRLPAAREAGFQALKLALQHHDLERRLVVYDQMAAIYAALGNYPEAYGWQCDFRALNDSLNQRQQLTTLAAWESRYAIHDKQEQIRSLTDHTRYQASRNRLLLLGVGSLLLALLGSGLLYWKLRRNRQALAHKHAELRDANAQVARLAAAKDRIYSIIAHDLRGPVKAFGSIADLLEYYQAGHDPEGLQALPGLVRQSATSLSHLLDNLLHWTALQNNELKPTLEPVDSHELLRECHRIYTAQAQSRRQTLTLELEAAPLFVRADRQMLRTVLRNLVDNALKFTVAGGHIRLTATVDAPGRIALRIADNGTGMPPEQVKHLLEPPATLPAAGRTRLGTGLGLVLCRAFTTAMQGRLLLQSAPGAGTTVTVLLPAA